MIWSGLLGPPLILIQKQTQTTPPAENVVLKLCEAAVGCCGVFLVFYNEESFNDQFCCDMLSF